MNKEDERHISTFLICRISTKYLNNHQYEHKDDNRHQQGLYRLFIHRLYAALNKFLGMQNINLLCEALNQEDQQGISRFHYHLFS